MILSLSDTTQKNNKFTGAIKVTALKEFLKEIKKVSLAKEWYNQALWKTKQMNVTRSVVMLPWWWY